MFNSKLSGKITEKYGRATKFAKAMGMSDANISNRLSGKTKWRIDEVFKAAKLLGIKCNDLKLYFVSESCENVNK